MLVQNSYILMHETCIFHLSAPNLVSGWNGTALRQNHRLDEEAALRFLKKAMRRHGVPAKITIDGSAANATAIRSYNKEHWTTIIICYYLPGEISQ